MIAFIAALTATLFLGAVVGFFTAALLGASKREDECHACPDRRIAKRFLDCWKGGGPDHGD